jgi:DNA-3-methyladenine glycosylase
MVCVSSEGRASPGGIWGIPSSGPPATQLRLVNVTNACSRKRAGELVLTELRMPARTWETPNIRQDRDVLRLQQLDKIFDAASRVPDGPNVHNLMHHFTPLPRKFYLPSARVVASALLGHWLIRNTSEGPCGGAIVETEAYLADDPACHAAPGLTQRNRVMFGEPGHAYVYLIYGLHFCVNAVCRPAGRAEAVLIRALEPTVGGSLMLRRRPVKVMEHLTSGPAKLCEAMGIDRSLDGVDLCDKLSPLFIARNAEVAAFNQARGPLVTTTRIGITRAAELPLRFFLEQSAHVSKR